MSNAIVLDNELKRSSQVELPKRYEEINPHNLYLYVKAYQAALRENSAHTKSRGEVSGGGKKPWRQKGRGTARAGSTRSPIWVGGGVAHGPKNNKNYYQKVNKKQKRLALEYAINEKAKNEKLFIVDNISIESGKTKDAANLIKGLNLRSVLIVKEDIDEKTFLAFRNLPNVYLIEQNELNGFTASAFDAIIIEKNVFEKLTKEG